MKDNKFKGLWPALFTPVKENGDVNIPELEKLIELLVSQEVDGLYILGSTGQGFLFSEKERKEIAELCFKFNNNRLPIITQVGALSTEESVRLAQHAENQGAIGISSVGPIYYGASLDMAVAHYTRIASATALPFFPYQIGNAVTNDAFIERIKDIPTVAGLKLTTLNMLDISNVYIKGDKNWKLFSGADELMCQAALCGTVGAIGSTYNLVGSTCKYVREEFVKGNVQLGTDFMLYFQEVILEILPTIWTFYRRAMQLRYGIDIGNVKQPLLAPPLNMTDDEIMYRVNKIESFGKA